MGCHEEMTPRGSDKSAPVQAGRHLGVTTPLHAYQFGPAEGVRVLLIHGLTGHGRRWESLSSTHLADVGMLAPDLLGHGRSSWDAPWTIDANVAALAALTETRAEARYWWSGTPSAARSR